MDNREYLFENKGNSVFLEFILDDFQMDKKEPADLEPSEFGILLDMKLYQKYSRLIRVCIIPLKTFIAAVSRLFRILSNRLLILCESWSTCISSSPGDR